MLATLLSFVASPVMRYGAIALVAWGLLSWVQGTLEDRERLRLELELAESELDAAGRRAEAEVSGREASTRVLESAGEETDRLKAIREETYDADDGPVAPVLRGVLDGLRVTE